MTVDDKTLKRKIHQCDFQDWLFATYEEASSGFLKSMKLRCSQSLSVYKSCERGSVASYGSSLGHVVTHLCFNTDILCLLIFSYTTMCTFSVFKNKFVDCDWNK